MDRNEIEKKKFERFARIRSNRSRDSYINSINLDGWSNVFSGQGVKNYDPDVSTYFSQNDVLTREEITHIFRGEGLGKRIVNLIARSMTREGFTVTGDKENLIYERFLEIGGKAAFTKGSRWASAYGGAVIVMGIVDGGTYETPVNYNNIKTIDHLKVYDRWSAYVYSKDYSIDKNSKNFGQPEIYTIVPIGGTPFQVHASRILRFDGEDCPDIVRYLNLGWGDSDLQGIYERLRGLCSSYANVEKIIREFIIGVMTVEGLGDMIGDPEGEKAISERLEVLRKAKHILNSVLIDKEEKFERISATTTGLPDLFNVLAEGLASAKGIPISLLMGRSPGGLNANGDTDQRFWYDEVSCLQEERILGPTTQICKIIALCKDFKSPVNPDKIKVEFNPLWQMSKKELAEIRKINSETDKNNVEASIIAPEECALSLESRGEEYQNYVSLLYKDRSSLETKESDTDESDDTAL